MYKKILNVILVILIIAIIGTGGYLIYTYYDAHKKNSDAEQFLAEEFDQLIVDVSDKQEEPQQPEQPTPSNNVQQPQPSEEDKKLEGDSVPLKYKGFPVVAKLEIPRIGIKYPVLKESTSAKAIEASIVKIYGPEINTPGNVVIAGHNYNNNLFFGKNKNLQIGDKIYITGLNGKKMEYTIYKKYYTPGDEYSYVNRETNGAIEVTLYTCDATGKNRLIICARVQ